MRSSRRASRGVAGRLVGGAPGAASEQPPEQEVNPDGTAVAVGAEGLVGEEVLIPVLENLYQLQSQAHCP